MLTGDLLRARATRDEVRPSFIRPDEPRHVERAEALVRITREAVQAGLTRGELEARFEEEIIGDGIDHKLVRGLAHIVLDRCEWDTSSPLDPVELRARLFDLGPVSRCAPPTAADAFARVATDLGCTAAEVERGMFADLKMNQTVSSCDAPSAAWVLHRYNVALVQGLLLNAGDVAILLDSPSPERARQLFRHVKFHQLMHRIEPLEKGVRITLDGPATILRLSSRYGMQLANFFPALLLQPGHWTLRTQVKWRNVRRNLVLDSGEGLQSHLPDTGAWVSREEEWFEERFHALTTDWTLERGGPLVNLGGEAAFTPDFTLRKGDRVAWLEVVGVWRRGWLQKRLDLLRKHDVPNLVLAVSRALLGDNTTVDLDGMDDRIVPFSKVIPPKDVIAAAERYAVSDSSA